MSLNIDMSSLRFNPAVKPGESNWKDKNGNPIIENDVVHKMLQEATTISEIETGKLSWNEKTNEPSRIAPVSSLSWALSKLTFSAAVPSFTDEQISEKYLNWSINVKAFHERLHLGNNDDSLGLFKKVSQIFFEKSKSSDLLKKAQENYKKANATLNEFIKNSPNFISLEGRWTSRTVIAAVVATAVAPQPCRKDDDEGKEPPKITEGYFKMQ